LYADNYVDIVIFDISNINQIKKVKIVENSVTFQAAFPNSFQYYDNTQYPKNTNEIIVKYNTELRAKPLQTSFYNGMNYNQSDPVFMMEDMALDNSNPNTHSSTGTGGSFARFQINNNALYVLSNQYLGVYDITNPLNTSFLKQVYTNTWTGGVLETLYKQGNYLFVGASNGMFVIDAHDEFNPTFISSFSHATGCDPVVVDGNTAYITIRGGTPCGNSIQDQINVIDVSNINQPTLISTYLTSNPMGLAYKNDKLYVCCGAEGLRVFNKSNLSCYKSRN